MYYMRNPEPFHALSKLAVKVKKKNKKKIPWFALIRKLGTVLSPQRCRIDFDDIRGDFQIKTTTKDVIISGLLQELLNRIT